MALKALASSLVSNCRRETAEAASADGEEADGGRFTRYSTHDISPQLKGVKRAMKTPKWRVSTQSPVTKHV